MHGPSHNTRSEKTLVVPRGKHSTTAAAEQDENPEQPVYCSITTITSLPVHISHLIERSGIPLPTDVLPE